MEKMKLQGTDIKVTASVGILPAWCLLGQTPASGKESKLRFGKMEKGKGGRTEGKRGMGDVWNHHSSIQYQRTRCCTLSPAVRHLPGSDTDSVDEA